MDENIQFVDEARLVIQVLAGDREAFGRLYDRYAPVVRAVAYSATQDRATVQDLTQECFLRAFRQLRTLQNPDRFGAWVVGIARQVVREYHRRRQPELLGEAALAVPSYDAALADDADEIQHVLGLVRRLPERERLAVHFFFLSERDITDTMQLLNLSRSGTYALLNRACARLARWLEVRKQQREVQP